MTRFRYIASHAKGNVSQITKIFSRKEVAGLAGYISNGILDAAGILKACAVLNDFKETAARFVDVSSIRLFATAALTRKSTHKTSSPTKLAPTPRTYPPKTAVPKKHSPAHPTFEHQGKCRRAHYED